MINLKIRINVDEQSLTLPVDTQFIPGIPEKDPVVMVTEITEPEELKYDILSFRWDKWICIMMCASVSESKNK